MFDKIVENIKLRSGILNNIEGEVCFSKEVFDLFKASPLDVMPGFLGPPNSKLRRGRGKDHPRYGRFVYAFARKYKPEYILEIGTYAGGTAVGWAKALVENSAGRLLCIDNDTYSHGTYPEITKINIEKTGLSKNQYELLNGDSKKILPEITQKYNKMIDIFLVDGDHTYEGTQQDLEKGLPMVKPGGFIFVHDVDTGRLMNEATEEHPHPVFEAHMDFVKKHNLQWCILKFIRKHLAIIKLT